MSQKGGQASFLSAFLNYAKVSTPVNVRSIGLVDSQTSTGGVKTGSCSPKSGEIKSRYFKKESDLPTEKLTALNTFINSPEKKQHRDKGWLVDFTLESGKKSPRSKGVKSVKEKTPDKRNSANIVMNKSPKIKPLETLSVAVNKSPLKGNKSPLKANKSPVKVDTSLIVKSPKVQCSRLSLKDLESSPSQNLRHRPQREEKTRSDTKPKLVREIEFQKDENSEMKQKLRKRKRKSEEEEEEQELSDSDSEVTFKPKAKRRKINLADTYKMAPLSSNSPLQTRGRKLASAVRGLNKTITEKRDLKKREKETKLNRSVDSAVSVSRQTRLRELRKRKHDGVQSSGRTRYSETELFDGEVKEVSNKKSKVDLRDKLDSLKKRKKSLTVNQKLKSDMKTHLDGNKEEPDSQSEMAHSKTSKLDLPVKMSPNSKSLADQAVSSFIQLSPKISPAKKFDMYSSPVKYEVERSSPVKYGVDRSPVKIVDTNGTPTGLNASPSKSLPFSSLAAGSNTQPPGQSHKLTASPKVKGLPAVLSLNTLSGIPQQIQGSSFSSLHPGFAATASTVLPNRMDAQFASFRKNVNKYDTSKTLSGIPRHKMAGPKRRRFIAVKQDEGESGAFSCNICGKVMNNPIKMRRHRREAHGIHKSKGKKEFVAKAEDSESNKDGYECKLCRIVYNHSCSLARHKRLKHGGFIEYKKLLEKAETHADKEADIQNDKLVQDTTSLKVSNPVKKRKKFDCSSCNVSFRSYSAFWTHRKIHAAVTQKKKMKLRVNGNKTTSLITTRKIHSTKNQKIHVSKNCDITSNGPLDCDICGRRLGNPGSLQRHRKVHTQEKPYKCETCGAKFNEKFNLKHHRNIHLGFKPYKCDECDLVYSQKGSLNQHLQRKHSPYNRTYSQKNTLNKRFKKVHSPDNKAYSQKGTHKKHFKKVHSQDITDPDEIVYDCAECGMQFSQRNILNRHINRVHSGSLPATPTPSTSDMGFFSPSPRPNTLSINSNNNSTTTQGITQTSSQSALDSQAPDASGNSVKIENESDSQLIKMKNKRTLAETVDLLRHSSNMNGMSVFKNNSLKKKTLTPSDDQSRVSSRNSSRSSSPNITPIKSEVLTPSCTPCSTPKKSPSCSPSPSLDRMAVTKIRKDQKYLFMKGDTVLAQWHDGLYYLGKILRIDEKSSRCLLQYEDDSKYWSLFKDIHRGAKDGEMICCVCMSDSSEKPNEIVLCDNCGQGYHQNCHTPVVGGSEILDPNDEWCCRKCTFALTMKAGGALKEGKYAEELRKMKLTFPYDLKSLSWDAQHKTNSEQYYCYCGGPGVWYQKMLQCCRCKQWFHETCIQCLKFPLLYADSFYIFVCTACNFGEEFVKRIHIDWPDLVHISIFNMSMENNLKYYEFDEDIMFWINENWDLLQVTEYDELDLEERKDKVHDALMNNKSRFKNGNEIRKRYALWGLRARVPPPRTHITLPIEGQVTEKVVKDLKVKGRRSKVFMPVACKTPVTMRHSPLQLRAAAKRRMLMQGSPLADTGIQVSQIIHREPEEVPEPPVLTVKPKEKKLKGPLLDRLIPPLPSYQGYNHPFKYHIEQTMEKIESDQRAAIWNYCLSTEQGEDLGESTAPSPDGPPVLVKEEPVDPGDMSPPLSECSETGRARGRPRKSETPQLITGPGIKRSKRLSLQKQSRSAPPELDENPSLKQQISVQKVRSTKANYLCAFDKFGYGKGMYVLGKRETNDGKLDYLISWQ